MIIQEEMAKLSPNIVLIGNDPSKSRLIEHYIGDFFQSNPLKTFGLDCYTKQIVTKHNQIRLKIWDTTEEGLFIDYQRYISSIEAFIFVYKANDREDFDYLKERLACLIGYSEAFKFLVATTGDTSSKSISAEESLAFAKEHSMLFYEINDANKTSSTAVFESIANSLLELGNNKDIPQYRCALIGAQQVGKTSLLQKYISPVLPEAIAPTAKEYEKSKAILINDELVGITVLDTCNETLNAKNSLKEIDIVILVYSITDRNSFDAVKTMLSTLIDKVSPFTTFIVLGNKNDLVKERQIAYEEGRRDVQERLGVPYDETNVVNGKNLLMIFQKLIPVASSKRRERLRIKSQMSKQ